MGNLECKTILTVVKRLCRHVLIDPMDVEDKSKACMRSHIYPPPDIKFNTLELGSDDSEIYVMKQ